MRCNGIRSYEFVMRCGWLRCHVVWFEVFVWGELENNLIIRTTQIYSVLQSITLVVLYISQYCSSTTPYYKVLLHYYFVLQNTTLGLFRTMKCYSSTILYYKLLLRNTKYFYYSSTILYYFVLQNITPYYKILF